MRGQRAGEDQRGEGGHPEHLQERRENSRLDVRDDRLKLHGSPARRIVRGRLRNRLVPCVCGARRPFRYKSYRLRIQEDAPAFGVLRSRRPPLESRPARRDRRREPGPARPVFHAAPQRPMCPPQLRRIAEVAADLHPPAKGLLGFSGCRSSSSRRDAGISEVPGPRRSRPRLHRRSDGTNGRGIRFRMACSCSAAWRNLNSRVEIPTPSKLRHPRRPNRQGEAPKQRSRTPPNPCHPLKRRNPG